MKTAVLAKRMLLPQQRADQFLNPLKERELHLRGEMAKITLFIMRLFADTFLCLQEKLIISRISCLGILDYPSYFNFNSLTCNHDNDDPNDAYTILFQLGLKIPAIENLAVVQVCSLKIGRTG